MPSFRALCASVQALWYVSRVSANESDADSRVAGIGAIKDVNLEHEVAARVRFQFSAIRAHCILVPFPRRLWHSSPDWTNTSPHAFKIRRLRAYA